MTCELIDEVQDHAVNAVLEAHELAEVGRRNTIEHIARVRVIREVIRIEPDAEFVVLQARDEGRHVKLPVDPHVERKEIWKS